MLKRSRALFVAYGGGHISMVLPVIEEIERLHPEIQCVLLALTTGYARASAIRPTLGYRDFYHLVDASAARAWGETLAYGNANPDVNVDETIAYMGINYLEMIAQHGLDGAATIYAQLGRYAFSPLKFMRRLLEDISPDVVVATNSPRSEAAALAAANGLGIPSVGMIDLFGLDGDHYLTRAVRPDWTCVISEAVRQRLLVRNFRPASVIATGNPAFDGLSSPENKQLALNFLHQRGWEGLSPILWAGNIEMEANVAPTLSTGHGLALEAETKLREFVRQRPNTALIVRYHPSEWHSFTREVDEARSYFSVPALEPIHPLILCSSVVVVQNSTVGLESTVAGRPTISLEYAPSVRRTFSLSALGISTPCHSLEDLPNVLEEALEEKASLRNTYTSDGHAAERVANTVLNAIQTVVF